MDLLRLRPMPPASLSLALLASVVALSPRLYAPPHPHGAAQIPGLTYIAQRAKSHTPLALVVTSVEDGGAAAKAGIVAGDVIDAIDGKPVASPDAVAAALRSDGGKTILLHIRHGGESRYKRLPADPGPSHVAENTRRRG